MNGLRPNLLSKNDNTNNDKNWRNGLSSEFKGTCPSLSYETRLWGFLASIGFGIILSFFSILFLYMMQIRQFSIYYTFGSITGLLSTSFLIGPWKQLKTMFSKNRWIASFIYLLSMAGTLFVVFSPQLKNLKGKIFFVLLCICIQFLAAFWYGLSYIPYGRKVVKKLLKHTCCGGDTIL